MQHGSVAEHERQGFSLIFLRRIDAQFLRLLQDRFFNFRSNPAISAHDPGGGGHAYVGSGRDLPKPYFSLFGVFLLHVKRNLRRSIDRSFHSSDTPRIAETVRSENGETQLSTYSD